MAKGVGAGTVLAFIIGSAGASLTELILLRSLFTLKLLAAFLAVIFAMAMIAGYATYLFFLSRREMINSLSLPGYQLVDSDEQN
ncbi:hypothetical protein VXE61_20720, partial [Acinetobacter nosocomialis]